MSGPKVVRIVSREEVEALCRAQMRDVGRAAAALAKVARRHDRLDAALEEDLARRQAPFERMFAEQQWMAIQKRGREEVAFLRAETVRIEADAVARAQAARCGSRKVVHAARSVVAALEASGGAIDADLRSVAGGAVADLAQARSVVERALTAMPSKAGPSASAASRALADRLAAGAAPQSFDDWLASMPQRPDPGVARIDAALSELATIVGGDVARTFETRAAAIPTEAQAGRRTLLTDSLVLEAAALVAAHRATRDRRNRVEAAISGLELSDASHHAGLVHDLRIALDKEGAEGRDALVSRAEQALATDTERRAASARRRALLSGLADLGYEVRQSMTTALAEDGRVIVRKPSDPDYGVEVSAPAGAARVQIRIVGAAQPATPRSISRDRDRETSWCGDVDRLKAILGAAGADFHIERALPVGAEPVKTVALEARDGARDFVDLAAPSIRAAT